MRGLALLLLASAAVSAQTPKLRALIFSGRNNHEWRETTPYLKQRLEASGRFEVRVNEEPAGNTAATLAGYDLLLLDYCGPRWGQATESAVEAYIKSGKGLVVVHAASYPFGDAEILGDHMTRTGRFEPPWMEYRKMVGAFWSRKEPPITGHGARHSFRVKFTDRGHPIAAGMEESFWATDELYQNFRMMPGVSVLATAFADTRYGGSGKDEPILWTLRYGRGRVFHTALGHNVAAMQEPGFVTTFARGAEWAATGAVTLPARIDPFARDPKAVRLLVVTGGHDYDTTFYTLFEGYHELTWKHATSNREAYAKDLRDRYDVLLMYDMVQEIGPDQRRNLTEFVEAGKGVVVLHHAIANYGGWPWWYEEVSGGKYLLQPEGGRPGSTYRHDVEIFVEPVGGHPVTAGIGPLHLIDEVYKGVWMSPRNNVLMKTSHPQADGPLVWIGPNQKSRVVSILLGHDRLAHLNAGFRSLVRNAVLWSAGRR